MWGGKAGGVWDVREEYCKEWGSGLLLGLILVCTSADGEVGLWHLSQDGRKDLLQDL
jgi:hypothetical protein